jgi:hypothetical protein
MKYSTVGKPLTAEKGSVSFPHAIEIGIEPKRFSELEEFLAEHFGSKHQQWRISKSPKDSGWGSWYRTEFRVRIRFAMASEAMRFKLAWS